MNVPMDDGAERPKPKLYLLGAFSLIGPDGRDYTPKSKKSRALLALLALSPRGTRTRVWLRDKLWSMSDEDHASGSLRQTIRDLKRRIDTMPATILSVEREALNLNLDCLWIDLRAAQAGEAIQEDLDPNVELLEGFDIADEEFEAWLMMERAAWVKLRDSLSKTRSEDKRIIPSPVQSTILRPTEPHPIVIGILPSIAHGSDHTAKFVADYVTEAVARSLSEYQHVRVVNLAEGFGSSTAITLTNDPDYLIRTRSLVVGSMASITFLAYEADNNSLALNQSHQVPQRDLVERDFIKINEFVSQNVDHLAKIILQPSKKRTGVPNDQGTLIGYRLLVSMFDLEPGKMDGALTLLARLQDREESSLFRSLGAYASSFAVGENLGGWNSARSEQTEKFARDVLQANPFNSISLACIGHTTGFVLNRHDIASEIFVRAVKLNPMQAFVWDHLALHRLYSGDLKGARVASDRAVMLGRYSPISYTYETTACMIAALQGDHRHAAQIGNRSLTKQPRFLATMRYTLSALGHLGEKQAARQLRKRLINADPNFIDPEAQADRFRLPQKAAREHILDGIAKAGL